VRSVPPGVKYIPGKELRFLAPVFVGDTVTARVEVTQLDARGRVTLATTCANQHGKLVIEGTAQVLAGAAVGSAP
jgi:phosphate acetyltransferase/phosphate butyryltransferase